MSNANLPKLNPNFDFREWAIALIVGRAEEDAAYAEYVDRLIEADLAEQAAMDKAA